MFNWKPSLTGHIYVGTMDAPVTASWFGGDYDPDDNGESASGINTKGNPGLMGCALPFVHNGKPATCIGSPLPAMPFRDTIVCVSRFYPKATTLTKPTERDVIVSGGFIRSVNVPVIDVGPELIENRPIDLTQAAFLALGGDLEAGLIPVFFFIIDGARHLFP